jgi:hypothetical protein
MTRFVVTLAAVLLALVASTLVSAKFTPLNWKDCSDQQPPVAQLWGVSITPTPQYLGQWWILSFVWLPLIDFDQSLQVSCTIRVMWEGITMHEMVIDTINNTTNPIAIADGFGRPNYPAGTPSIIADNNTIPAFVPIKGPFYSTVYYTSPRYPGKKLMCFEYNQTYA